MIFISVIVLFALSSQISTASIWSCGSTPVWECKTNFGAQFEDDMFALYLDTHEGILIKKIQFYKEILDVLPEDDEHVPGLEKYIAQLMERLHKLDTGIFNTPEGWIDLQKSLDSLEPDFSNLRIGKEAETAFELLLEENGYENLDGNTLEQLHDKLVMKTAENWSRLYAGLRTIDLLAYPDYKYLNRDFSILSADKSLGVKYFDYMQTMRRVGKFFDKTLLKVIF